MTTTPPAEPHREPRTEADLEGGVTHVDPVDRDDPVTAGTPPDAAAKEAGEEAAGQRPEAVEARPGPDDPPRQAVPQQWDPQPKPLTFAPQPPSPGFIATRWPGPSYGGGPAAWLSALLGGLATAIALPLTRPGAGWFLVGLVIIVTVGYAARFGPKPDSTQERLARAGWAGLALALLSVGAFLNAYWLHYICVLGALGCFALAVAGGHSVRAIFYAALTPVSAFFRAIPWLAAGASAWSKARTKNTAASRTGVAVLATIVLLLVFGGLFAWADTAFASIVANLMPDLNVTTTRNGLFKLVVGGLLTAGAVFIVLAPPDLSGLERPAARRIGMVELVLPLGALVLLFGGFVAVQLRYLFSSNAPKGHNFSTYAVQGFGQLVVVTLLTLLVIGCAARWAPKATRRDRIVLRTLLGLLVGLSMVIVASAVYRMWLYMNALGWTRERLFFGAVEIYLGFLFLLVVIAGVKLRASWFPRAVVASFALLLLGLAAVNPERYIAERNVDRFYEKLGDPSYLQTFDLGYLQFLTSDAIGELVELPEPYRSCALLRIHDDLENTYEEWYSWNLSRERARQVIAGETVNKAACAEWNRLRSRR